MAVNGLSIQRSSTATVLPSPTSVITLADSHDKATFLMVTKMKEEPMDVESLDNKEEMRLIWSSQCIKLSKVTGKKVTEKRVTRKVTGYSKRIGGSGSAC